MAGSDGKRRVGAQGGWEMIIYETGDRTGGVLMTKCCPRCDLPFKTDELVELTVIAPYKELKSKVTFSIGQPVDSYPESLIHHTCHSGPNVSA